MERRRALECAGGGALEGRRARRRGRTLCISSTRACLGPWTRCWPLRKALEGSRRASASRAARSTRARSWPARVWVCRAVCAQHGILLSQSGGALDPDWWGGCGRCPSSSRAPEILRSVLEEWYQVLLSLVLCACATATFVRVAAEWCRRSIVVRLRANQGATVA